MFILELNKHFFFNKILGIFRFDLSIILYNKKTNVKWITNYCNATLKETLPLKR
jgi:hypothetical protein